MRNGVDMIASKYKKVNHKYKKNLRNSCPTFLLIQDDILKLAYCVQSFVNNIALSFFDK